MGKPSKMSRIIRLENRIMKYHNEIDRIKKSAADRGPFYKKNKPEMATQEHRRIVNLQRKITADVIRIERLRGVKTS